MIYLILFMERFSNFLNSYTKSFNKANNRKGALFMDYLKRSVVKQRNRFHQLCMVYP